jgi:hypothetical protein
MQFIWLYQSLAQPPPAEVAAAPVEGWDQPQFLLPAPEPPILGEFAFAEFDTPLVDQSWNQPKLDYWPIVDPVLGEFSFVETDTPLVDQSWNTPKVDYFALPDSVLGEFAFVETDTPLVDQSWNTPVVDYFALPDEILGSLSFVEFDTPSVDQSWNTPDIDLSIVPDDILGDEPVAPPLFVAPAVLNIEWFVPPQPLEQEPDPPVLGEFSFIETPTPLVDMGWLQPLPPFDEQAPWPILEEFVRPATVDVVVSLGWLQPQPALDEPLTEPILGEFAFVETDTPLVDMAWLQPIEPLPFIVLDLVPEAYIAAREVITIGAYTSFGVPFLYTAASWFGVGIALEVYMRATAGTVHARMFDETSSLPVAGSDVNTMSSSFVLVRSGALGLVDTHVYISQFALGAGSTGWTLGARPIAVPT